MNIKVNILCLMAFITFLSSCDMKDGEIPCPPEPRVKLNFYAEKFRNKSQNPLDDREEKFCDRINHIRYFLYKDNALIEERIIDTFDHTQSDCFSLEYDNLTYGNYKAVVIGNSVKTLLEGDPVVADNMFITFPGCADTEDYFTAVFPFTVNSDESKEYEVGLLRAHGVIRYTFNNLPSDIVGIEVVMKNVASEKWITGDYKEVCDADNRFVVIPVSKAITDGDYVIGTFPTPGNEYSAYYMNLYRENDEEAYFSQMISDTLTVTRNQLLEIATDFNDGNVTFEVILDSDWNGSLPGGIGEIQE